MPGLNNPSTRRPEHSFMSDDVLYMHEGEIDEETCTIVMMRNLYEIAVAEDIVSMHKRVYGFPFPQSKK